MYINSKITLTQCHNQEKRKNFMTVAKWQRAIISMSLKQPAYWLKLKENKETINKLLIRAFLSFFDASGHSLEVKYLKQLANHDFTLLGKIQSPFIHGAMEIIPVYQ